MKQTILAIAALLTVLLVACAPAATPTPEAMKPQAAPTVEAMMDKPTPTAEAMMPKETATPEAMMPKETTSPEAMMPKETTSPEAMMGKLPDQITAAHFVDSAPKHGDKFAQAPTQILINFNFTLHEDSAITVTRDGAAVDVGKPTLGEKKLSLSATLPSNAGDGLYVVKYKACWPDRSCHDGVFAFTVDSKMKGTYLDLTGKSEVTVRLKGIQFSPQLIMVSRGTKVTWVNDDPVVHFVNSDPHPSHNVVATLNSLEIQNGESFSYTFDQAGEWAIHCSAHVPQNMLARVIVDS
ncbi:MAG: copper resistance protein CopC [Chloroflexi bacterium]|nr:copper resistance protein CopC [Chloroflexota bacterium]